MVATNNAGQSSCGRSGSSVLELDINWTVLHICVQFIMCLNTALGQY